ncbi:MAG: tRNA-dihydrouridine synthase [Patescibacteria group bacterium]|nr:tRNA-dihydrouridine synthase [Patescibacteria group bacterium]
MKLGFWKKIKKPILVMAPMLDVTDAVFRQVVCKCGKPDVMFTEFVSVDGLTHKKSKGKLMHRYLRFSEKERPIVAQIWGTDPEKFYESAKIISKLGFDGIDINMGCPDKKVVKAGAGAGLILNPILAQKIIQATKKGAGKIPVSVKTRIGYDKNIIKKWITRLLEVEPAAIIIHGRTKKEMSKVPARWDAIGEAVKIAEKYKKKHKSKTLILGNGDISELKDAYEKMKTYKVDGVMIGRAVLSNPWFFNKSKNFTTISLKEKLGLLKFHVQLFNKFYGKTRNINMVKKYIKGYISGFKGSKEVRADLMPAKTLPILLDKINRFMV